MKPQLQALQPVLPQAAFIKPEVDDTKTTVGNIVDYMLRLNRVLEVELSKRVPDAQVKPSFYLSSPDGSIFKINVDNAGVLSTTKVFAP